MVRAPCPTITATKGFILQLKIAIRAFALWLVLAASPALAVDFFVAATGTPGKGSEASPFGSLANALSNPKLTAGDRIILRPGRYGDVRVTGAHFRAPVSIIADPKETIHFESLIVGNSSNLHFSGIKLWPINPEPSHQALVQSYGDAVRITFDNFDIRSQKNALAYRSWSEATWQGQRRNGVLMRGDLNTLKNSQVTGAYIAISASGERAHISNNKVSGFSGDAIRALGNHSLVTANYAEDCFQVDGNHADGFQSWSLGADRKPGTGVVRGLTIQNNVIVEWADQTRHPLRCALQGIGLFDGMFEDLTIQNNVISARAYHGISVAGAINSTIVNNTVVNADGSASDQPWIGVFSHKNGTPSRNVTVANNAAMAFRLPADVQATAKANLTMARPMQNLEDPLKMDFRPRRDGGLVDSASNQFAPPADVLGVSRPQNGTSDIGAFELH